MEIKRRSKTMRNLEKKVNVKNELIKKLSANITTLTAKKADLEKTLTEKLQTEEIADNLVKIKTELMSVELELEASRKLLEAKKEIPAFTFEELKAAWEKRVPIINKDLEKQEEKFQAACDAFIKALEDYNTVFVGYLMETESVNSMAQEQGIKKSVGGIRTKITNEIKLKIDKTFKIDAAGAQARAMERMGEHM